MVLASPEIRFYIDSETHDPIEVQAKQIRETNSMVEEFMLLANISVAEKIYEEFPEYAILRRHPTPPLSNFDPLIKAAKYLVSVTYSSLFASPNRVRMRCESIRMSKWVSKEFNGS